jgi:hydrogenase/urease accessory protein HupE
MHQGQDILIRNGLYALARVAGRGLLGVALGLSAVVHAHLMPEQRGTINVQGDSVYVVLSIPVTALTGFDDNKDLVLSTEELQRHQAHLREQIDRRLLITHKGQTGQTMVVNLVHSPLHEQTVQADQLIVLKHVRFAALPSEPAIHTDLFGTAVKERELTLRATRGGPAPVAPTAASPLNPSQARPGEEAEVVVLSALRPSHEFFQPWPVVLGRYVLMGAEHVLLGWDHLLFLLTVVIAASGWRYWLYVITAFTLAHSITLGLALFKLVNVDPAWVEPAIAASIVVMALDNLFRAKAPVWQRVALVFACGLLHGLGFAASISAMGLDGRFQWASLIGFNFGIEVGQVLFLAALLAAMAVTQRALPSWMPERQRKALSVLAALAGAVWVVQRLM